VLVTKDLRAEGGQQHQNVELLALTRLLFEIAIGNQNHCEAKRRGSGPYRKSHTCPPPEGASRGRRVTEAAGQSDAKRGSQPA